MVRAAEHEKYHIATNHWRLLEVSIIKIISHINYFVDAERLELILFVTIPLRVKTQSV